MNKTLDKYQLALQEAKKELQECQERKGFNSCTQCEEIFTCKVRKEYVDATYNSMAKDQGGGFEF
jgi:hypothetical protein